MFCTAENHTGAGGAARPPAWPGPLPPFPLRAEGAELVSALSLPPLTQGQLPPERRVIQAIATLLSRDWSLSRIPVSPVHSLPSSWGAREPTSHAVLDCRGAATSLTLCGDVLGDFGRDTPDDKASKPSASYLGTCL